MNCFCENPIAGDSCAHTLCKNCRGEIFLNQDILERVEVLPNSTRYKDDRKFTKLFTLEDIRKFCLEYDKYNKDYPESKYEGRSLYSFIDQKLDTKTYNKLEDYKCETWEKEMKDV